MPLSTCVQVTNRTHTPFCFGLIPSFLARSIQHSCVSGLGYDLEAKCKDIAARRRKAGGGPKAGSGTGKGSTEAAGNRQEGGGGGVGASGSSRSRSAAPNYTSESVIVDIYGHPAQGSASAARERSTRASRRTASSVSREWCA